MADLRGELNSYEGFWNTRITNGTAIVPRPSCALAAPPHPRYLRGGPHSVLSNDSTQLSGCLRCFSLALRMADKQCGLITFRNQQPPFTLFSGQHLLSFMVKEDLTTFARYDYLNPADS